jgi:hypothetical protein
LKPLQRVITAVSCKSERAPAHYKLGVFHDSNRREAQAIPNYKKASARFRLAIAGVSVQELDNLPWGKAWQSGFPNLMPIPPDFSTPFGIGYACKPALR